MLSEKDFLHAFWEWPQRWDQWVTAQGDAPQTYIK
jgi:hypothetical protein